MGIIDYILENALKIPRERLYRHECRRSSLLCGDMRPELPAGTPVYCYFPMNLAEHSGICIGNRIVHLDGSGDILCSSPQDFLARLNGCSLETTIFYAATDQDQPLSSPAIAARAKMSIGKHRHYNLLTDNCHGFTMRCLNGDSQISAAWSIREIENTISEIFRTESWRWRRWDGWIN